MDSAIFHVYVALDSRWSGEHTAPAVLCKAGYCVSAGMLCPDIDDTFWDKGSCSSWHVCCLSKLLVLQLSGRVSCYCKALLATTTCLALRSKAARSQQALSNPKPSNSIQKHHPHIEKCHTHNANLNSEAPGESTSAFLHCGDVFVMT